MALNTAVNLQGVPLAVSDLELFVLSRGGIYGEVRVPGGVKHTSEDGTLYLTTLRLVYVPAKRTAAFGSYEVPLALLSHESFNQPIFGANNLSGSAQPLHGGGIAGTSNFCFYFYRGGVGTFLPLFFRLLEDTRRRALPNAGAGAGAAAAAGAAGSGAGSGGGTGTIAAPANAAAVQKLTQYVAPPCSQRRTGADSWPCRHAYVDPNDPSHVYVQQPVFAAPAAAAAAAGGDSKAAPLKPSAPPRSPPPPYEPAATAAVGVSAPPGGPAVSGAAAPPAQSAAPSKAAK